MDDNELYLNVCQAIKANASNTAKKHDNLVNTEAILVLVEIVNRSFERECIDLKEATKYLTQVQTAKLFEREEEEEDDKDEHGSIHVDDKINLSSGSSSSSNDSSSSDGSSSSSDDATSSDNASKEEDGSEEEDEKEEEEAGDGATKTSENASKIDKGAEVEDEKEVGKNQNTKAGGKCRQ